ncbi:MAG: hypothetical protein FWF50_05710, partial [Defluviitaleaceae bacterium]|nr:hypothetical protein [Defluviitaleaceae bacterium]
MSRCDNNVLISKVGMKPLNKTIEVDFAVLTDLENCVRINTRNYVETQGSPVFSPSSIPNDMFGCLSDDCENSGTLNLTGTGSVNATFISRSDATLFSVGVITYYVFFRNAGTYTVRTAITDITDTNFNNRDEYFTNDIEVFRPGFHPVVVDLSEAPLVTDENTDSNGWTPMRRGIRLRITVSNSSGSGSINAGISSIFIYNSIEDFEVNDVVKVGCIDEFSGEFTLDARDASCFGVGYDPASISIERTITGR